MKGFDWGKVRNPSEAAVASVAEAMTVLEKAGLTSSEITVGLMFNAAARSLVDGCNEASDFALVASAVFEKIRAVALANVTAGK